MGMALGATQTETELTGSNKCRTTEKQQKLIKEEEIEVPMSKEPLKMNIDMAPTDLASTNETDVNMQDALVTENGAQDTDDSHVQIQAGAKIKSIRDMEVDRAIVKQKEITNSTMAEEVADPFEYCYVVTMTTHKSLRGPRVGMIFYRKGLKPSKKGQPEDVVGEDPYSFWMLQTPILEPDGIH
ncbi:hypothetical protein SSX86_011607 [Deinandra increscens subsp. villosa]|uniref:Serine hydroxymethyltransferase-like domain-containing protein n=1 Tax=Deinandra increscens subsp. villosa TaxID=3103831 RepID=A0AAP0H021_9ASTR